MGYVLQKCWLRLISLARAIPVDLVHSLMLRFSFSFSVSNHSLIAHPHAFFLSEGRKVQVLSAEVSVPGTVRGDCRTRDSSSCLEVKQCGIGRASLQMK